ncbi:UNVERIFIED_CONTAM: hypothetical protein Scaly_0541300 [Sesamum calycinum]|uniref:Bet v I/Major latex protein domain-containing protein n=1 Tax=Sesamum calycinum TaxID=2727403 RepID=A0AAW2RR03_9LAMI
MMGRVWEEMEVKVPASEAWKLYGSLLLTKVVVEVLPHHFNRIEVVEGDGSAGTILHIFLDPGGAEVIQGEVDGGGRRETSEGGGVGGGRVLGSGVYGLQDAGGGDREGGKGEECIVRGTIEYELKEEAAGNAALVSTEPLRALMQATADYLTKNYNPNA